LLTISPLPKKKPERKKSKNKKKMARKHKLKELNEAQKISAPNDFYK